MLLLLVHFIVHFIKLLDLLDLVVDPLSYIYIFIYIYIYIIIIIYRFGGGLSLIFFQFLQNQGRSLQFQQRPP